MFPLINLIGSHFADIIKICKYVGYITPAVGAVGAAGKYVHSKITARRRAVDESQKLVSETNKNVLLLMENHLPHIQEALDKHDQTLVSMQSDFRDMGTKLDGVQARLDDSKESIHRLGEAFVRHLENSAKEAKEPKRRKVHA